MKCLRYLQIHSKLLCLQASLAGVLIASLPASAEINVQKTITAEEASQHVQETNTVCGVVASTKYLSSKSKLTLLNLGKAFPDHVFTAVIPESARAKFKEPPEVFYKGKTICVTGPITTHNEKPQIMVDDPAQIEVRETAAPAATPPAEKPASPPAENHTK
jgi:hypothetical protein